jgi:hypothetical protein
MIGLGEEEPALRQQAEEYWMQRPASALPRYPCSRSISSSSGTGNTAIRKNHFTDAAHATVLAVKELARVEAAAHETLGFLHDPSDA